MSCILQLFRHLFQANFEMIYTQHKMMAYCELDISDCHHLSPQLVSIHTYTCGMSIKHQITASQTKWRMMIVADAEDHHFEYDLRFHIFCIGRC